MGSFLFCFLLFKVHPIWAARKGEGGGVFFFFKALTLGSTDNFLKKLHKRKKWMLKLFIQCFERDRSVETMSFRFCVKNKKTGGLKVTCFWGFIFPVHRNLLSRWSNLYGYGLEELRQRLFSYSTPMLTVVFVTCGSCVKDGKPYIPMFEGTVHP